MPPLQPRELACLFFSSVHRLVFCGCLSANVRAAGTMATANLEGCKKRNKLQSITSKLCVKTQICQIGNLLEEFSACQHFCELFQSVNASWFIPNCFRQSEVVWSCFPQNDDRVCWKEYYQKPHIFSIGLEIKKPRLIQRHRALVLVHLTLFAYSIPFFVCLYCFFSNNQWYKDIWTPCHGTGYILSMPSNHSRISSLFQPLFWPKTWSILTERYLS